MTLNLLGIQNVAALVTARKHPRLDFDTGARGPCFTMKRRLLFASILALISLSCSASLSREVIANHPRIKLTVVEPQVVERSDPFPPPWTRAPERGADAFVAFLGQSSATTMDAAKQEAMRDLLSAVSSFVSVDVESESLDIATEKSQQARSVVKTQSASKIEGIKADAFYWERVAVSPLATESVNFRYFVHARVPRAEIIRARAKKMASRKEASGKRTIVILPFRPVLATPDLTPLANAFAEELGKRLADLPNVRIADAVIVQALLAGGKGDSDAEAIEAVRDAFLPDAVISGGYQLHEKKLRVTYSVFEAGSGEPKVGAPVERTYDKLFDLEDALVDALRKELGAPASRTEAPTVPSRKLAAFELYNEAYALFRGGKNDDALERLNKALAIDPAYADAHFRAGRVLERLGRYGFIPPVSGDASLVSPALLHPGACVSWEQISDQPREEFLSAIERPADAFTAPSGSPPVHENVDHVYGAIEFLMKGGSVASPGVPLPARTAIGSYYHAYRLARGRGDSKLEADVLLAVADLLVRVDRVAQGSVIYAALEAQATAANDLHLLSLVHFGQGRVLRLQALYAPAERKLLDALGERAVFGEKPYLLEIMNELGGLEVEASEYRKARYYFKRARRIADDLDDAYFRAVLSNNLGVLDYLSGDAISATANFDRAYEYLKNVQEAEGQIFSGINVAQASAGRGELDRARAYVDEAQRIVRGTAQESRLSAVYQARGQVALRSGDRLGALRDLLRGWTIERRLDRLTEMLRMSNAVIAAEYYELAAQKTPTYFWPQCLQQEMHTLFMAGYGGDPTSLDVRFWHRYVSEEYIDYAPFMPFYAQNYRHVPAVGVSALYMTMNAEALARIAR